MKCDGTLQLGSVDSGINLRFHGDRCPDDLKEVPAYVAKQVAEVLKGIASDGGADALKKANLDLQAKVDELKDELAAMKKKSKKVSTV